MERLTLRQDWHVRLVVTAEGDVAPQLQALLAVTATDRVAVLACDTPALREGLASLEVVVHFCLPPVIPAGAFLRTVCSAPGALEPGLQNVLLRAGADVPVDWDARLAAAGQLCPDVAALAPLSARHPVTTLFNSPAHQPGLAVDALDQWLNDYSTGEAFPIAVLPESCLLLQGRAWHELPQGLTDDAALADWLAHRGESILVSTQLYVDDSALPDPPGLDWLSGAVREAGTERSRIAGLRHALSELSARGEQPAQSLSCLPVQLHVGHSWGGGLGRWMEDYIEADTHHRHLVLRSIGDLSGFGLTIALYASAAMDKPLRSWTLALPVLSVSQGNHEYRGILDELVSEFHVESLVVSSLVGHSLDVLHTGLPTTLVLHDFFPFCPALYATYDSPCQRCDSARMAECARGNPQHAYFKLESDEHWESARQAFLDSLAAARPSLVAPSQSVVSRYRQLMPSLADLPIAVVPHGLQPALVETLAPPLHPVQRSDALRRVVVLGRLTPEKGADILEALVEALGGDLEFVLLGTGESGTRFAGKPGVTVQAQYAPAELGGLLRDCAPDFALLLSVVPETFGYTLSELQAAGIPVLATRVGAYIERIEDGRNGWLAEPSAEAVLARLRTLLGQPGDVAAARDRLSGQPVRDTREMAADYAALEPGDVPVPTDRYDLPRRTYANPYTAPGALATEALTIGRQVAYRQVLVEFLRYSAGKAGHSPRLPGVVSRPLAAMLRAFANSLSQ